MLADDTIALRSAGGRAGLDFAPGRVLREMDVRRFDGVALDTFDGALRRSGRVLIRMKERVALLDLRAGEAIEQQVVGDWRFAERLPDGGVRSDLMKVSRLRAFLPIFPLSAETGAVSLLDEGEKTIARGGTVLLEQGNERARWLSLRPLRGCAEEVWAFAEAALAAGYEPVSRNEDWARGFSAAGPRYESKPAISLEATAPIMESGAEIMRVFLDVARRNEEGVIADWDTEFLHDYRVSLRRVRSLLSLLKGVYDENEMAGIARGLADAMKSTNRLRDLDVFLMERSRYVGLAADSGVLFDALAGERAEEWERMAAWLKSAEYDRRMRSISRSFLAPMAGARGGRETERFARSLMFKRYRKVSKFACSLVEESPAARIHEFRIQCKKLRYGLELFATVFPREDVRSLIKSMKALQDALGSFNDGVVRIKLLGRFAEGAAGLTVVLDRERCEARAAVAERVGGFVNESTRAAFKNLNTI